jgi:hypothetical protein
MDFNDLNQLLFANRLIKKCSEKLSRLPLELDNLLKMTLPYGGSESIKKLNSLLSSELGSLNCSPEFQKSVIEQEATVSSKSSSSNSSLQAKIEAISSVFGASDPTSYGSSGSGKEESAEVNKVKLGQARK